MAKLYFKYGAMGSSKTAQALITKFNYEERGMKVWLIKPALDDRDGAIVLKSRIGLAAECTTVSPEDDIYEMFTRKENRADVIITDECQFFTPENIDQMRRRARCSRALFWSAYRLFDQALPRLDASFRACRLDFRDQNHMLLRKKSEC